MLIAAQLADAAPPPLGALPALLGALEIGAAVAVLNVGLGAAQIGALVTAGTKMALDGALGAGTSPALTV